MILKMGNAVYFGVLLTVALLVLFLSLLLKNKSVRTKRTVLLTICAVNFIIFIAYKVWLSMDAPYSVILQEAGRGAFNWFNELPLALCNINVMLIPAAILTKKRALLSFCFYVAPLGALMAMLMPSLGFNGYSLLLPRMLGFFLTHGCLVILGLCLGTTGLYVPRYRDLPLACVMLVVISILVHCVNLLFVRWGLSASVNYFFTMDPEGIFLLELFWSWLPKRYLYLLPALAILIPYMALLTALFRGFGKKKTA